MSFSVRRAQRTPAMTSISNLLGSSSFRLAAIYAALFGVSVFILLAFIYWSTAGFLARQTDETIESEIRGLAEQYRQRGTPGLAAVIRDRIARDPAESTVYLLADEDFTPLVGNLNRWPDASVGADGWIEFRLLDREQPNGSPRPARARAFRLRGGLHLLVGRDIRELQHMRDLMLRSLSWGVGITLMLALIGGAAMSHSILRRIEAINQTSREIMTGDLSRRIPTKGTGDDFDQLAESLNEMLDRIETLMAGVRQVSDNIAHDLRTPLTRLRGGLEQLRREAEIGEAGEATLEQAVAEADRLLTTFGALLRIAEIDSGGRRASFQELAIDSLVNDVAEFYEPLAQEKGQRFNVLIQDGLRIRGDRDILFQALANALDNAVKYAPPGGAVSISLARTDGMAEIVVSDTGRGIPSGERDKVFQRFYRLEHDRSAPGNGLGLSLVAAAAKLHQATVDLEDNDPGLRLVLRLPLRD